MGILSGVRVRVRVVVGVSDTVRLRVWDRVVLRVWDRVRVRVWDSVRFTVRDRVRVRIREMGMLCIGILCFNKRRFAVYCIILLDDTIESRPSFAKTQNTYARNPHDLRVRVRVRV
jgi:hypothetical protein